ncbi:hypothetical protein C8Q77DRAFT_1134123 [Trametes polyzona]|nr:hypothetical protein C8Q77DRAFT_1134123 [Trametes polyzona]
MAKATSRGDVSGSESEAERTRSARRQSASASKSASKDKGREEEPEEVEGSEGDEEEDEEEFEIEAILEAKQGTFPGGRIGYLVKWKGYGEEHNSWVDEKDAEGAQELIKEFWKNKKGGPKGKPGPKPRKSSVKDVDSDAASASAASAPAAKKRGRPSKAAAAPQEESDEEEEQPQKQKKPRKSTGTAAKASRRTSNPDAMDEDEVYMDMHQFKDAKTWEHLVQSIDTVERTEDGHLYVYFTLKHGKGHGKEKSDICKKKMPYKLLEFYESNLRWKPTEEDATMEE